MAGKHDLGILILVSFVVLIAIYVTYNGETTLVSNDNFADGKPSPPKLFKGCHWVKVGGFDVSEEVEQEVISCNSYSDNYDPYAKGYIQFTYDNTIINSENKDFTELRETITAEDECIDYSVLEEYSCANSTLSVKSTGECTHGCNNGRCNRVGKLICSFFT